MKKQPEKENGERWLLTYSDLITLLMILFVIMYAMSSVDKTKYQQLASSLSSSLGGGSGVTNVANTGGSTTNVIGNADNVIIDTAAVSQAEQNKLEGLKKEVDTYLDKNKLSGSASANIQERGLVISISDTLIFDSGSADLKAAYESRLIEIGKMLTTINNYIVVEGNTDNVPITTHAFKDNWDLASERANNVMRVLLDKSGVQPIRISARSNGEYRPVVANDSDAGRARNRRVDIVILDNKYSSTENNQAK